MLDLKFTGHPIRDVKISDVLSFLLERHEGSVRNVLPDAVGVTEPTFSIGVGLGLFHWDKRRAGY